MHAAVIRHLLLIRYYNSIKTGKVAKDESMREKKQGLKKYIYQLTKKNQHIQHTLHRDKYTRTSSNGRNKGIDQTVPKRGFLLHLALHLEFLVVDGPN